jgi:hypothetical protein
MKCCLSCVHKSDYSSHIADIRCLTYPTSVYGTSRRCLQDLSGRNVDFETPLTELAGYEAEIANIESRFTRITDKLFYLQPEDDALVRQRVEQLIEMLNDAFGVNNYSRQISADFNHGFRNHCLFIASVVFCGPYE